MADDRVFKLEITMESQKGDDKQHIKRSFPVEKGTLDISKYGYPYNRYRKVEIGHLIGIDSVYLEVGFDNKGFNVYLNKFTTIKNEYAAVHIDAYLKVPVFEGMETVHTTFYLYVE